MPNQHSMPTHVRRGGSILFNRYSSIYFRRVGSATERPRRERIYKVGHLTAFMRSKKMVAPKKRSFLVDICLATSVGVCVMVDAHVVPHDGQMQMMF